VVLFNAMSNERRVILESVLVVALAAAIGWFPFKWTVDVFPDPWAAVMWWWLAAIPGALWIVIRSRAGVLDSPVPYHFAAGVTVGLAAWLVVGLAAVGMIVVSSIIAPCETFFGIPGPSCGLYSLLFWGVAWILGAILPAATMGLLTAVFGYIGWKWRDRAE
jgi:hypothetical protein